MFQLSGKIKVIKDTQVISDKFQKREFVVTEDSGNYPQHILFQLKQDSVSKLDDYNEGDDVSIGFFINGREWTSPDGQVKYFNSLDVWKLDGSGQSSGQSQPSAAAPPPPAADDEPSLSDDKEDDDLPF